MPRKVVLEGPLKLVSVRQEVAAPPPGGAVVRVVLAGVCGTDLAIWRGDYRVPLPLVLGHEFVGRVEAVGEGADPSLIGRRVVSEINNTCLAWGGSDVCPACRRRMPNHCTRRTTLGITGADGAFADYVTVASGCLHPIPDGVGDEAAVFVEPLAAACRTFELAPIESGDVVVVLGAGRLGLLVCAVAASEGARVVAVAPSGAARGRALGMGAAEAHPPGDESAARVLELTEGLGADVVVECTGSPDGLAAALSLVRPMGVVALKTTCGVPSAGVDVTDAVVRELRLVGSRCGPFATAIDLLASSRVDVGALVSEVLPLADLARALQLAEKVPKVLVRP